MGTYRLEALGTLGDPTRRLIFETAGRRTAVRRRARPAAAGEPAGRVATPAGAQGGRARHRPGRRHAGASTRWTRPAWPACGRTWTSSGATPSRAFQQAASSRSGRAATDAASRPPTAATRHRGDAMNAEQTLAAVRRTVTVGGPSRRRSPSSPSRSATWWPPDYHVNPNGYEAAFIEPRVGGRWFERAPDGSECDWGRVLAWDPPRRLAAHLAAQRRVRTSTRTRPRREVESPSPRGARREPGSTSSTAGSRASPAANASPSTVGGDAAGPRSCRASSRPRAVSGPDR